MSFSVLCVPILSTIKMKLLLFATVLLKCQTELQTNWFQSSSAEFSSAACEPSSCLCYFVKPQQELLGNARLTPIKNNTAMGSTFKEESWKKYCSWKWSHQHPNTAMETRVQEKLKPMGISSAQTELHILVFIPILGSAEGVFTHQACGWGKSAL